MKTWLMIFFLLFPAPIRASVEEFFAGLNRLSPPERHQRLVEGAKKEGEVMLYSSSGLEEIRAMTKAFAQKYPFIKTRFVRRGGGQLFNVSLMEFRGQKYVADVYWAGESTLGPMFKQERAMMARYLSPERDAIGDDYKDREGYWTATRISVAIFAYHAKKVPPEKIPRSYPDLLDPFWKGKIAVDTNPARFTRLLVERMRWSGAEEYLAKLAQQDLRLLRGRSARLQLILGGEVLGALDINADNIVEMQLKGAPVEYALLDPTLISLTSVAMPQRPPHPHAAGLLYDFILSREGQQELSRENNVPVREDVEAQAKELVRRLKEAMAQKKISIQSPATHDPAVDEKLERLYTRNLVKRGR